MIPKVRTWRVRFYVDSRLVNQYFVETVNKRFALMDTQVTRVYWQLRALYGDDAQLRVVCSVYPTVKGWN